MCPIIIGASFPSSIRRASASEGQLEDLNPKSWVYRPKESAAEDHYLHIILPVLKANVETCKTLLTGVALNYPTPWIVSWDEDSKPGGIEDGKGKENPQPRENKTSEAGENSEAAQSENKGDNPTRSKMEPILQLLEVLPPKNDNDTILILGNPETWFQVRPEVLLKRYLDIQYQDTNRLSKTPALKAYNLTSRIVFAADKSCPSGTTCLGITTPESISEKLHGNDGSAFHLSHDLILGRLRDVRPLYQLAVLNARKAIATGAKFTEHSIFADIYASQEAKPTRPRRQQVYQTCQHRRLTALNTVRLPLDFAGTLRYSASSSSSSSSSSSQGAVETDETTFLHHAFKTDHPASLPKDIASSSPPFLDRHQLPPQNTLVSSPTFLQSSYQYPPRNDPTS